MNTIDGREISKEIGSSTEYAEVVLGMEEKEGEEKKKENEGFFARNKGKCIAGIVIVVLIVGLAVYIFMAKNGNKDNLLVQDL